MLTHACHEVVHVFLLVAENEGVINEQTYVRRFFFIDASEQAGVELGLLIAFVQELLSVELVP